MVIDISQQNFEIDDLHFVKSESLSLDVVDRASETQFQVGKKHGDHYCLYIRALSGNFVSVVTITFLRRR